MRRFAAQRYLILKKENRPRHSILLLPALIRQRIGFAAIPMASPKLLQSGCLIALYAILLSFSASYR